MARCDGRCSTGIAMSMQKTILLAFAAAVAAATLPVSHSAAQNGSTTIFIPNNRAKQDQRGEHYDNVVGNYTRRCASLDGQFNRLRARMADSAVMREASALHEQGVEHCNGGARLQGIDELTAAIREIGGIPRVEL
jgi:hypothetical protein